MRNQNATLFKKKLREKIVLTNGTRSLLIPHTPMYLLPKNLNAEAKARGWNDSLLLKPGPSVKKWQADSHLEIVTFGAKNTFSHFQTYFKIGCKTTRVWESKKYGE